ncbi:hypothetical protein BDP27DRAFT_1367727 [Rhodocollybia butyracea]|uniref:Uncharacterized protein n=1 Tax=Rhodocollybia butyracea TaxID=206335 RepID=A0A9P5PKR7_9AGAR|nr:hypothetical protein BDP27DRAFT_1367727 [Rhodocollybia butyracea]
MAVIDSDKEKIPPLSLRTSHALAYAKRELRMALFSKDAEDLLAVNAELKAVEDLYATTTERFERKLSTTPIGSPPSRKVKTCKPTVYPPPLSSVILKATAAKSVDSPRLDLSSPVDTDSRSTPSKPATRRKAVPEILASSDTTSVASSAASTPNSFTYVPGGIYQAFGAGNNKTFRLIDDFQAPVIQPVNVMSVDGDKLYVVYWGHNDMDLITSNWHGIAGAKNATHGLTNAIHRRFLGPKLGAAAYKECCTTGILAALKDKMANKHFIVVKGENPGVYVRQTVVSKGLKWHGGEIICLIGNAKDAQDLFKHLEREPMTVSLPQDLHWGIARDLNTSFCIDLGVLEPKHQLCLAAFVTPNIELN